MILNACFPHDGRRDSVGELLRGCMIESVRCLEGSKGMKHRASTYVQLLANGRYITQKQILRNVLIRTEQRGAKNQI